MGIDIFFVVSFLTFLSGMIFVYKVPEKVSLFRSMIICFITELCFGAVIAGIYSIAGIRVHLISMGIAYLIMGMEVWGLIVYQKRMQKLEILKVDIYAAFVIVFWFLIIFIKVFTPSILNTYTNSDPAVHYKNALRVMDTGRVSAMYFAEVYNGLVMELLAPFVTRYNLYKAFILADSFANLLNVFLFYCLTIPFVRTKFSKIVIPFLGFLYFAGWPFYSYAAGGFVYFGWGVTLFAYVVYMLTQLYESQERRNQMVLLGLVLIGCFSVLVCYLIFIVSLAAVVLVSLICIAKKNGIVVFGRYKIQIGIAVLIMGIGAFSFCFWGYFGGDISFVFEALRFDGGIAKELYQDFIFLIPAFFYMGWKYIKNKEINIIFICISALLAYILCTFAMCWFGLMSSYYYYKSYYLLWLFTWVINMVFIDYLFQKDKALLFSYGGTLLFAIFITLSGADSALEAKGIVVDDSSVLIYSSPFPIWDRMEQFFVMDQYVEDKHALIELSRYINDTFPKERVPMLADVYLLDIWYNTYTNKDWVYITSGEHLAEAIQEYKEEGRRYIAVYQNTERYWDNKELLLDYENIFDNGYYGVYMLY